MELALRANLSTTFINSIENQQRWVSPSTLSKLAKSLQAYPHELFLSDDAPQNTFTGNSEHQHMITELRDILEKYT
nr:helix-turn-helix transcriptional regulator [Treponema phagedenis]